MMMTRILCVLICWLMPLAMMAVEKIVPANSPEISFTGRVQCLQDGSIRYDWVGTYWQTEFTGNHIAAVLSEEGASYHNIYIDGKWLKKIKVSGKDAQKVVLADKLSSGKHILRMQKCTEGEFGCTILKQVIVDSKTKLSAVKPTGRMIEVIGDSYTCGYGTESNRAEDPFELETENCDKAYACIVARYFNADYALVAHSGQGMVRHWADSVQISRNSMPERWTRIFDAHGSEAYDFQAYTPQLVMINLGTNDFSPTAIPTSDQYVGAYVELILQIKARYGQDIPVLCITPHSANTYLRAALAELKMKTACMEKVYMANDLSNTISGQGDLGASYHPNYMGQCKIAMSLIPQVATIMGWEVSADM